MGSILENKSEGFVFCWNENELDCERNKVFESDRKNILRCGTYSPA